MILKLETERLSTLDEVRMFVAGSAAVDFAGVDRESTYEFTRRTLARFDYGRLGKADKGLLRRYLMKATGLSRAQVARLIGQHAATGRIADRRGGAPSKPFARVYTAADARRLAEADELLGQLSGPATRAVMRREFEVFGDARFKRLAYISNGHLYNLRKSQTYQRQRTVRTHQAVGGGDRRAPQAAARRPAGVRAGGFRASGRPRRAQGRLRDQPGGRPTACGRRSPSTSSWAPWRPSRSAS